ncbi:hypothetical protein GOBAR_AA34043 [Gossypium barbadense]|uniref:Uncharacterized protein n=1 Tax=Gossypium barbadense TaxID=3634 RepID=A0A2P5W6F6_GOSBA|nr:hypothetical protein GOBAR_AA34043 [Gossypium barbadense]
MPKIRGISTTKENRIEEGGRKKKGGSLNWQIKSIGGLKLPLENGIAIKSELKEKMEMAGIKQVGLVARRWDEKICKKEEEGLKGIEVSTLEYPLMLMIGNNGSKLYLNCST